MTEPTGPRSRVDPPELPSPPRFVERRVSFRRAADRLAHRETVLLARSLDVLAGASDAEAGLAGLLRLVASTAGARRVAVLSDGAERRVAVHVDPGEGAHGLVAAEGLAAWLDASAPRSRAARAASGRASVAVVGGAAAPGVGGSEGQGPGERAASGEALHHRLLAVPGTGDVVLGFAFRTPVTEAELGDRLPPQLVRHAAVALALVTRQVATEREVASLRARDDERTRYVSTVAHELRTPLTGLAGYLDLILDGKVDDPAVERDFMERGRGIVTSMADLVGDLLELSRLESGSLRLDIAPFSLAEATARVAERLAPIALRREIRLGTALPPRLRAATGDRRRFEQVLTNLAANAIKFSPPGGTVEVAAWFEGPVAIVAVRDAGQGIGPDERRRIFERFYRIDRHERISGTGLGLPIARELARACGGDLDVASVPGSGTSFVVVLPGPAPAGGETIAGVLQQTLSAEEIRLEESAVLRALQAAGRPLPRPRLVPADGGADGSEATEGGRTEDAATDTATDATTGQVTDEAPPRLPAPRLRSIDGHAGSASSAATRPHSPTSA